jgi:hypothetical protein
LSPVSADGRGRDRESIMRQQKNSGGSSMHFLLSKTLLIPVLRILIGFSADPDPAFFVRSKVLIDDQKLEKKFAAENVLHIFLIKKCNLLIPSLGLYKGRPSYRRSLHPSKKKTSSTQNLNFLHFCGSFWPSWIRNQPTKMNADPQHWLILP